MDGDGWWGQVARWVRLLLVPALLLPVACGRGGTVRATAAELDASVTVASFNFDESELLGELFAQALGSAGVPVDRELRLGARELVSPALRQGLVDVVPEYVGSGLAFLAPERPPVQEPDEARRQLQEVVGADVVVLPPAEAQDQNGFVVRRETAERHGLRTISDLRPVAADLVFGGPPECRGRRLCLAGLEDVYQLRFEAFRPLDSSDTPQEHQHVTITEPTATTPTTDGDFAGLGLPPSLVSALTAGGITAPFPIQAATIPDALTGRDVLGRGQTGSGKTLAFGLPMLARLAGGTSRHPRGLVLVPTRELAMQVTDVLTPLARTVGLSTVLVAGGMSYTPQLRAFQRGVDVVVATPGRLIDLMDQNAVDLTRVETIVLDEADHMADLGFMPAVTQILDTIPAGGQRMLFSATLDGAIDRLVKRYLSNPVTHEVDSGQASVTTMEHHLVYVAPHDKATLTAEIAGRRGRTVVFVRTQRGADRVAEQLRDAGVMAGALHGGLTQGARTRILSVFKEGDLPVLVATDVAARGIHVDEVGLVLQVDPPAGPKEYLHRAGRTARAGGTGVVVTLALPHQRREMTRLTSQAGVKPQSLTGAPGDAAVADVTGAVRPTGVAVSSADYERLIAPPRSNRRPSGDRGSRGPRSRSGGYEGRRPQRRSFER